MVEYRFMDFLSIQNGPTARGTPTQAPELQRIRIDKAGRLVVPASIRKALGIENEQTLTARLVDGGVHLQTLDAGLERVWAIAKRRGKTTPGVVDDFIAERRAEAADD